MEKGFGIGVGALVNCLGGYDLTFPVFVTAFAGSLIGIAHLVTGSQMIATRILVRAEVVDNAEDSRLLATGDQIVFCLFFTKK